MRFGNTHQKICDAFTLYHTSTTRSAVEPENISDSAADLVDVFYMIIKLHPAHFAIPEPIEQPIMSSTTPTNKQRKAEEEVTTQISKKSNAETETDESTKSDANDFTMMTLEDIRTRIHSLCLRVPVIPEGNFGNFAAQETNGEMTASTSTTKPAIDESLTREWAAQMQVVLEEFDLLACCVATATYRWGTDRSGAADQNLSILRCEMAESQNQISSTVTPRLSNVLDPDVALVVTKTVTSKDDATGVETKENQFTRILADPDCLSLRHTILARNAPLLKQVVLSNFHKVVNAVNDYLLAQTNDTQHSRGYTY
jgi:hypothetical protein